MEPLRRIPQVNTKSMVKRRAAAAVLLLAAGAAVARPARAQGEAPPMEPPRPGAGPAGAADRVQDTLPSPLRELAAEVLDRNPDVARARAAAVAAELRAPQVRALPDPMASLTAFLLTPETRVGPQQAAASLSQRFPWFGKLAQREQEALYRAAAARAEVEARRLAAVTEARRLYHELAFLAAEEAAVRDDRATLDRYEELARARYASGVGLQQAVVKIQAEITKDDNRLVAIATRRVSQAAALNALRDRPAGAPLPELSLPAPPPTPPLDAAVLTGLAQDRRPELTRSRALLAAAGVAADLAAREYKPDLTLGLAYTLVGRRADAAGRAMPPEGNGDDVLGLTVGVNLPVWRRKLAAGVEEAAARELAAQEEMRAVTAGIDQSLGDLAESLPLIRKQLGLFEDLLEVQAGESLRSAEAAYSAGSLGALDLLDAERVLIDVRVAAARARADYLVALARLEGALGAPLTDLSPGGAS
jgi:cobalt-zinc-cadmium efflux system outer membrane protein